MVMIRPLLKANRHRHHRAHTVVFFIFLVANIGGGLTPLGDPPLFLGFLHGVPFFWTLGLWRQVCFAAVVVLAAYVLHDLWYWSREPAHVRHGGDEPGEPIRIDGAVNLLLLAGVVAAVVASGAWHGRDISLLGVHQETGNLVRDAVLLVMLATSWFVTPRAVRAANEFSLGPIQEVAILFAGIFITIIPAMAMLRVGEDGAMAFVVRAVREPAHFFWASGILSSFLDNAPTYLAFLSTALGRLFPGVPEEEAVRRLIAEHPAFLVAISNGAVFMGANTYIGNAPNFMVKSIAEEAGVPMPSFFGYILRYSLPPGELFMLMTWLFFDERGRRRRRRTRARRARSAGFAGDRGLDPASVVLGDDVGLDTESIGEWLRELIGEGHHVALAPAALAEALAEAIERGGDEIGLRVERRHAISGAQFGVRVETFSREAALAVQSALDALPAGVRVEDRQEAEQVTEDGRGVELYAPVHGYRYTLSARVAGAVGGVLEVRRRLSEIETAALGPLTVAEPPA
jgi:Na+/H+ antiporter NhaD/arsenite permease-like protein